MAESLPSVSAVKAADPKPVVLIGIATHNRAGILPKAIQSALAQKYPNVEVAVLDDGSDDETSALQSDFPVVHWYRWESSRGYLEARNQLMRTTSADYYLSLDDDAWFVSDDETAVAIDYLEATPTVAAIAFDILSPDRPHPALRTGPHPTSMFIGCGHVLRISALCESGFYTPSPGFYGSEEKDLCLRLLDHHWEIHLLPGVHIWHDKTTVARDIAAQHRSGVCNDLAFAARRCPFPLVLAIMPVKVINQIRFSVRNHLLKSCLAGLGLFCSHAFGVWRSRQPVRARTFLEFLRRSYETR